MRRTGPRDPAVTSRIMSKIRGKDGKAECQLRRELSCRKVRYRKHYGRVLGTPDIAIPWAKVAVFIDGDFWHGNAWRLRGLPNLAALFPTRTEYWVNKITRNMKRDRAYTAKLRRLGWTVLRFWESEILKDAGRVADRVIRVLNDIRSG
jgi:DNA mismatch endonuclease, patch repair protein